MSVNPSNQNAAATAAGFELGMFDASIALRRQDRRTSVRSTPMAITRLPLRRHPFFQSPANVSPTTVALPKPFGTLFRYWPSKVFSSFQT